MSRVGTTLLSGSRFVFWSLGPVLFLGGLAFLGLAAWAFPSGGQTSRIGVALLGLFCLVCVPVLYNPARFWVMSRVVAGAIFVAYLGYFVYEWFWHSGDIGVGKPRSAPTPLNATRGLLVIGLPCLWWTLFGRFSMRRALRSDQDGNRDAARIGN